MSKPPRLLHTLRAAVNPASKMCFILVISKSTTALVSVAEAGVDIRTGLARSWRRTCRDKRASGLYRPGERQRERRGMM